MECSMPKYLLLLGLISFSAFGAVTKWVDDSGQVHYTDQAPPPDVQTKLLGVVAASSVPASSTSASGVTAPKSLAEREAEFKKAKKMKAENAQKIAKQKEEADAKQKYCEDARINLKSLEDGVRISTYDANGERTLLDDAARQQRIEETRKGILTNCSN